MSSLLITCNFRVQVWISMLQPAGGDSNFSPKEEVPLTRFMCAAKRQLSLEECGTLLDFCEVSGYSWLV
jgi:hypothetical protein